MKKCTLFSRYAIAVLLGIMGLFASGVVRAEAGPGSLKKAFSLRDGGEVVINESFTQGLPEGWLVRDHDGDGKSFEPVKMQNHGEGSAPDTSGDGGCMSSSSFPVPSNPLNNWLITPRLNLPQGGKVSLWTTTYSSQYPAEKYDVCYSTTGTQPEDFTVLMTETLTRERAMSWKNFELELPVGTKYVAVRHYDSEGDALKVDDIKISGVGASLDKQGLPVYALTLQPSDRGVVVVKNKDGGAVNKLDAISEGTQLKIYAVANEGFNFHGLTVNGVTVTGISPATPYVFNIAENVVVGAIFKKPTYAVVLPWGLENGTVTLEGLNGQETWAVEEGTELTIVPVPNEGYRVASVLLDGVPIEPPYKFVVTKRTKIEVTFEKNDQPAVEVTVVEESFTSKGLPEGWVARDFDGNARSFEWTKWQNHGEGSECDFSGTGGSLNSDSFNSTPKPLSNWLIAPRLNLPQGGKVSLWTTTYSGQYPAEKYDVCYSTTGNNPEDFKVLMSETLTAERVMVWQNFTLELPAGTKYVAVHHYDCKQSALSIDDIKITGVNASLDKELPSYAITLEPSDRGNVVVRDKEGVVVEDLQSIKEGTPLKVHAVANEGFIFKSLTVNGVEMYGSSEESPYLFNVGENTTLGAIFKKRTFGINLPWNLQNGTIRLEGLNGQETWAVEEGTEVTIVPIPNEGYKVGEVRLDGEILPAPYKFILKKHVIISVTFVADVATYEVVLKNVENGTIAIEGKTAEELKTILAGTELTVVATPNENYELKEVTVNGQAIEAPYRFTVNERSEVGATFQKKVVTYPVTLQVVGEGTASVENYTEDMLKAVPEGATLKLKVQPKQGHLLKSITVNGEPLSANVLSFTVNSATTVIVTFEKEVVTYPVTLQVVGEGTASIKDYTEDALKAVPEGTRLVVNATPAQGHSLKSIAVNGQMLPANTTEFVVSAATTVVVTFEKDVVTYAVTLAPTTNGTISIKGKTAEDLKAVVEGTELTVKVTPADKYELKTLTANGADIKTTRTFVVNANVEVVATFQLVDAVDSVDGKSVVVYPNPAQDFVVVEGLDANTLVRLTSIDGHVVAEAFATELGVARFEVSTLARGNYLVVVQGKAQVVVLQ
ncbi:T9SS-dependent choice-of-anchor J family protein [Porphyromonas circumdentaria]|uniref:Por secretion system C-terminal sorting domain-containing protein n=1 Tax=Porphyromonas circumdentaria TaxID=29524 RepID=A0A1T4M3I4_9PORP|nr:choice-of-anchor J domain-containing protein [Porphyromonas circumdentaria]MBB6275592.1 hypothetical protein [Porphyromonas circumdentaria]SJZ61549.1 Por secretion system C-terminal sorting domain-containing protein [Porphyromonas circumdentaria]